MYFIPHLFKKDLIRHKVLLFLWFLMILAHSSLGIVGVKLVTEHISFQMFFPMIMGLFAVLQGLMIIVIVPLYIHEDSLAGSTAFWLTRPISRKGLLITKSFFILSVFIGLPLLAELFVLSANGAIIHHLLLAVPEILLEKFALIIPFLLLAAVTPKFSRYALVGIIIFAGIAAFGIISSAIMMYSDSLAKYFNNPELYKNPTLLSSVNVAKNIFIILAGSILVSHQFLTRHTSRTIILFVLAFLIMPVFTSTWRWDFLKDTSITDSTVAIPESLSVSFDSQYVIVSDEFRLRKEDPKRKSISIKQIVNNLPMKQFAILKELENARMKYPDWKVIKSECVSTSKRELFYNEKFMLPLQTALKDIKILNPYKKKFSFTEILSIEETELHLYKNKPGTYLASGTFDIYEYKVGLRIPLRHGTNDLSGSEQTIVYDILEKPNGVLVIISEKKINLLFDTDSKKKSIYDLGQNIYSEYNHVYLIVNKERGEGFLAEVGDDLSAQMAASGDMMAAIGLARLTTKVKQYYFSHINDRNELLPKIDDEWIDGAELVRLDAVKIGTKYKSFKIENFSLPSQSTEAKPEIDVIDLQLRQSDKNLKRQMKKWE
jgi:hypothetical protein